MDRHKHCRLMFWTGAAASLSVVGTIWAWLKEPYWQSHYAVASTAIEILGVAFAALCVGLTVRVMNRRERWAKRVLFATIILVPVIYLGSFGPAMRHVTSIWAYPWEGDVAEGVYRPIFRACANTGMMSALWKYLNLWGAD